MAEDIPRIPASIQLLISNPKTPNIPGRVFDITPTETFVTKEEVSPVDDSEPSVVPVPSPPAINNPVTPHNVSLPNFISRYTPRYTPKPVKDDVVPETTIVEPIIVKRKPGRPRIYETEEERKEAKKTKIITYRKNNDNERVLEQIEQLRREILNINLRMDKIFDILEDSNLI
jgi:hypothetical protein